MTTSHPDHLALAARVVATERLLGRCVQLAEDEYNRLRVHHRADEPRMQELLGLVNRIREAAAEETFSPAVGGQAEEDQPDPLGLADQPGLLVDESGSPVDLGLPATASAWADEMRPEYDFSEAARGPVIVRQTLGSTGPASDAASELLGFLAGLSRYFPNGSQAEEIRLRGMEFVRNAADPLALAARVAVLEALLERCVRILESAAWDRPWPKYPVSQEAQAVLASPSPAAQAVREVVAQVLVRRAMKVRGVHGTGRNTGPIDEAAEFLATNFPALAAGLEEEP